MKARDCSTAELLRVIGEERLHHHPDDVSGAEAELIARLGGPFTLGGWAGKAELLVRCLVGLCMAALAVALPRAGFEFVGGLLTPGRDNAAAALLVAAGVALPVMCLVLVGGVLLVARWNPHDWLGRGALRLIGGRLSLDRGDPSRAHLIRVVGAERRSHPEGAVEEALRQIRELHRKRLRATRRNVRFLALLGACYGLLVTRQAARYLPGLLESGPMDVGVLLLGSASSWVLDMCGLTAQVAGGLSLAALFVGCGGVAVCRDWARRVLSCVFAAWALFSAWFLELAMYEVALWDSSPFASAAYTAVGAFCLVLSWDLFRSVLSPSVREVCGAHGKEAEAGPEDPSDARA